MYTEHVCANFGRKRDDAEAHLVLAEEENLFRLGGGGLRHPGHERDARRDSEIARFSLYIKPVTEALGFTRQGFSVCQTLTNVIYMGIALFSGKIFERFKALGLMRIACIVLPAAYFCYSLCTQLWMFYAVSVVVGGRHVLPDLFALYAHHLQLV